MNKILLTTLCLGLLSCSGKHSNQPSISDICKAQLMKFIEEGTKTNTMSQQGTAYKDLRQQVANTTAAYELVRVSCAANLLNDSRQEFDSAIKGWGLAIKLIDYWEKYTGAIENTDAPLNSDRYILFSTSAEYKEMMKYADDRLVTTTDIGGTYLQHVKGIPILTSIAGEHFIAGRAKILQTLQQPQ